MALYQTSAGDRILAADINQFYQILKGVAASGEAVTLIYNAAASLVLQPSSDPAAGTEAVQIKNNAGTVQSALSFDGRFYAADGLVGTPGITFEQDKDTGIYRTGTNVLDLAAGGVRSVSVSATALSLVPATSKIVPGATSLSLRNNGDSADNLLVADNGTVTARLGVQVDSVNVGRHRSASYGLTNNQQAQLFPGLGNSFTGLAYIVDRDSADSAIIAINGGNNSVTLIAGGATFTVTVGTGAKTNVYYSVGNTRYEIENKRGSTRNYAVFFMVGD